MRIRQIVFVVRDLAASSARLAALLDLDPPYRDPGVAEFGLDNAVFVFGDQFIELVSPVRAGTAAGRHLERRGEGGYMLILQTEDFERDRARIRGLGVRTVWEKELPDIRAMHLHPKDIGGAIVSIDQPVPAASWRWGGPQWRAQEGPRGRQSVVAATLEAEDPQAMAARWAEVLGLQAPIAEGARRRLALDGGALQFGRAGVRGEGIAGFALAVTDRAAVARSAPSNGQSALEVFGARIDLREL
jgi:catechol 2,3-dioxygenase-like lactoylglutathione lyase family enzyme